MVPRYSRPAMTAIWSAENRYRIWWAIEVFAAEAMGKIGMIPAEDAGTIRKAYDADVLGEIDVPAIDAIEAVTKHDVIAFLTWAGRPQALLTVSFTYFANTPPKLTVVLAT